MSTKLEETPTGPSEEEIKAQEEAEKEAALQAELEAQ